LRRLDFGGGHADPVAFGQHLVFAGRVVVDANKVVVRFASGQALFEQSFHRGALIDLDVVREAAAVVVDEQNLHESISLNKREQAVAKLRCGWSETDRAKKQLEAWDRNSVL